MMKSRFYLLLLACLLPVIGSGQSESNCDLVNKDLDGDLLIGAGDVLELLSSYGAYLDTDGDEIPDCQDDCVGTYDTCGVCNGPGPQVLAIDTIIITHDSVYVDAINDWLLYELSIDTLLHLVCSNPGCTDPVATNFDPYAQEGGLCEYGGPCLGPAYDGHTYSAVQIGDQCWFAENLRSTIYADGTAIPEVTDNGAWTDLSTGARCDYNVTTYGWLYNWYAVDDPRGLCPSGWHVPTDGDWTQLEDHITSQGFAGMEGAALKSTTGWNSNGNGTDDFGFSALPGGQRTSNYGSFYYSGSIGFWWSSSSSSGGAWSRYLYGDNSDVLRGLLNLGFGFSVRCLRDSE